MLALEPAELVDLRSGQPCGCDQVEQVAVEIDLGAQPFVRADLALRLPQDEAVGVTTSSEMAGSLKRSSRM